MDREDSCDSSSRLRSHVAADRRSHAFSVSRRFDRDAMFGGDGRQHPNLRHASRSGSLQFAEHLIEAATRGARNEDTRRLIARVAESMTPAARRKRTRLVRPDAARARLRVRSRVRRSERKKPLPRANEHAAVPRAGRFFAED